MQLLMPGSSKDLDSQVGVLSITESRGKGLRVGVKGGEWGGIGGGGGQKGICSFRGSADEPRQRNICYVNPHKPVTMMSQVIKLANGASQAVWI